MLHRTALRVFAALPRRARHRVIRLIAPTFTAGALVCITDPDGRVLLASHSYSAGWGLPGGLIGRREDPTATAVRELREELGLDLALDGPPVPYKAPGRQHFNFLFRVGLDPVPAAIRGHSPEIVAVGWFALDDLPELAEYTEAFLETLGLLPLPGGPESPGG